MINNFKTDKAIARTEVLQSLISSFVERVSVYKISDSIKDEFINAIAYGLKNGNSLDNINYYVERYINYYLVEDSEYKSRKIIILSCVNFTVTALDLETKQIINLVDQKSYSNSLTAVSDPRFFDLQKNDVVKILLKKVQSHRFNTYMISDAPFIKLGETNIFQLYLKCRYWLGDAFFAQPLNNISSNKKSISTSFEDINNDIFKCSSLLIDTQIVNFTKSKVSKYKNSYQIKMLENFVNIRGIEKYEGKFISGLFLMKSIFNHNGNITYNITDCFGLRAKRNFHVSGIDYESQFDEVDSDNIYNCYNPEDDYPEEETTNEVSDIIYYNDLYYEDDEMCDDDNYFESTPDNDLNMENYIEQKLHSKSIVDSENTSFLDQVSVYTYSDDSNDNFALDFTFTKADESTRIKILKQLALKREEFKINFGEE